MDKLASPFKLKSAAAHFKQSNDSQQRPWLEPSGKKSAPLRMRK